MVIPPISVAFARAMASVCQTLLSLYTYNEQYVNKHRVI